MSDEDAASRAALITTGSHPLVTEPDRAIYRAGIVAGMRRAAEIAKDRGVTSTSLSTAHAIKKAADKLEHEQEQ